MLFPQFLQDPFRHPGDSILLIGGGVQERRAFHQMAEHDCLAGVESQVEPARGPRLRRLTAGLQARARSLPSGGMALIHRDFYGAQLLRSDRSLWLLDYDTLGVGHPELDVATYAAHAVLEAAPAGAVDADRAGQIAGRFVDAYAAAGGRIDRRRLAFYLPCALARLGAIQVVRPIAGTAVEMLWALAESYLG